MTKKSIAELADKPGLEELAHDVSIEAEYTGRGPAFDASDTMDNWTVSLEYKGRTFPAIDYHMGIGNSPDATFPDGALGMQPVPNWKPTPPTAADVLHSLILDANARDETFPEWCDSFGHSDDSIKAKATYDACILSGIQITRLLGDDFAAFETAAQDY